MYLLNGVSSLGVVSHFLHPDDVLDINRNSNKKWSYMEKNHEAFLSSVYKNYKWLRAMTASEGELEMKKYLSSQVNIEYAENMVKGYCNGFYENQCFIFKTAKKVISTKDCSIEKIDSNKYSVIATKPCFSIKLGE